MKTRAQPSTTSAASFSRTPIRATETGDTLRVEIGPVDGSYHRHAQSRAAMSCACPPTGPPIASPPTAQPFIAPTPPAKAAGTFEGNTLTTVIPVPASPTESRVIIEVHRAPGLSAKRAELDGFAGAITRLRAAYDAMNATNPVSQPPDPLIDAMQTGDRLGYHPERAAEELAHLRQVLPQAQSALDDIAKTFPERVDAISRQRINNIAPEQMEKEKQSRLDAMARAQKNVAEAQSELNSAQPTQ